MNIAVLIPALKPDGRLVQVLSDCAALGLDRLLVVDDGSGGEYRAVFDAAEALGARVLRHEVNRGKGAALKTGIRAAAELWPDAEGVVTADADGQHTAEDILKVALALEGTEGMVLGQRELGGEQVPVKSRLGNAFSAAFFKLTTGVTCRDTQTGLRGIPRGLFDLALETPGERYDFEMNLLTEVAKQKKELRMVPIRTIYLEGNSSSHFRVVRDSALIYRKPLRYLLVAGGSALLDLGVFTLLTTLAVVPNYTVVTRATVIARCISGVFNFKMNQIWCFQVKRRTPVQAVKYLALFLAAMVVSSQATALLRDLPLPLTVTKAAVDLVIFYINFQVQSRWIFRDKD